MKKPTSLSSGTTRFDIDVFQISRYIPNITTNLFNIYQYRFTNNIDNPFYNDEKFKKLVTKIYGNPNMLFHYYNLQCLIGSLISFMPYKPEVLKKIETGEKNISEVEAYLPEEFESSEYYSQLNLLLDVLGKISKRRLVKHKKGFVVPHFRKLSINIATGESIIIKDKMLLRQVERLLDSNMDRPSNALITRKKRDDELYRIFWCSTKILFKYLKDTISGISNAEGYRLVVELCRFIGIDFDEIIISERVENYLKKVYASSNCP